MGFWRLGTSIRYFKQYGVLDVLHWLTFEYHLNSTYAPTGFRTLLPCARSLDVFVPYSIGRCSFKVLSSPLKSSPLEKIDVLFQLYPSHLSRETPRHLSHYA
jgi:hypothetical protein